MCIVGWAGRKTGAGCILSNVVCLNFTHQLKEDIQRVWVVNIYTQLWSESGKGGNHFADTGAQRRAMLTLAQRNVT